MRGPHGDKPADGEKKSPRSSRGDPDERSKDWHVSKRLQDRIVKRQEERRKREESFRKGKRGRIW